MRFTLRFLLLIIIVVHFSCNQEQENLLYDQIIQTAIIEHNIPGEPSIRGLDVLDSETVWLSGSKGIFARSIDGGKSWDHGTVNNDTLLDFRDIHVFSQDVAIVVSAGSPARIYKTLDGGQTWIMKYENIEEGIFFDSFEFWDNKKGIACSDPVDGDFFFIITNDGGETWEKVDAKSLPKPLVQEAGFAASGTSVAISEDGTAMFGTGGTNARIILSKDFGKTWTAVSTPINTDSTATGIYSIATLDNKIYAVTGGSYLYPEIAHDNFAISMDGGTSWNITETLPSGFRSCVRFFPNTESIITCGRNGIDISPDLGKTWIKTHIPPFYAMDISPANDFIVFAGSNGRVSFINLNSIN